MVMGVALFVAAPLIGGMRRYRRRIADPAWARLEQQHAQALQGLRELEFDREMGKLSDEDCADLRQRLESKALAAMAAQEKLRAESRAAGLPAASKRPAPIRTSRRAITQINVCPDCGARLRESPKFCTECGVSLDLKERASS